MAEKANTNPAAVGAGISEALIATRPACLWPSSVVAFNAFKQRVRHAVSGNAGRVQSALQDDRVRAGRRTAAGRPGGDALTMAMMRPSDDDLMAEINITPFTDVLLVLLIIFMVSASAIVQAGSTSSCRRPRRTILRSRRRSPSTSPRMEDPYRLGRAGGV